MSFNQAITQLSPSMTIETMLASLAMLVGIAALLMLWRGQRRNQRMQDKIQRLERTLKVANGSAIGMGQQIISLEKQCKKNQVVATQVLASIQSTQVSTHEVKPKQGVEPPTLSTVAEQLEKKVATSQAEKITEPEGFGTTLIQNDGSVYDDARRYLARGRPVNEVARECGLSHAEVSLLDTLSKQTTPTH